MGDGYQEVQEVISIHAPTRGATFFALFVFPLIVEMVYERMLYDKNGKLLQRRI